MLFAHSVRPQKECAGGIFIYMEGIMWNMIFPILIVLISNTAYNICAKSTPAGLNTFASLSATYFVAMMFSLLLFKITTGNASLISELKTNSNWTSWILGLAIVGLEGGFILAYRAGWKIGTTQFVAAVCLTVILLFVGYFMYNEVITLRQLAGIVISAAGLFLVLK